jgi:predicted SAM-dependent methyltransferase
MKLNIGAGNKRYEGYINCDFDNTHKPEYFFNLGKETWPFEDNSVEEVIAHHVLEHLGEEFFHVLNELYRVCKHNSIIDIRVPHWTHHNFYHNLSHVRVITPWSFESFNKQKYGPNEQKNLGKNTDVNFRLIDFENIVDPGYPFKERLVGLNKEQIEAYAYERNNVYSEIHIRLLVIKDE